MKEEICEDRESRLFPALTIAVIVIVIELLPGRLRLMPRWFPVSAGLLLVIMTLVAERVSIRSVWARVERTGFFIFGAFIMGLILFELTQLLYSMATGKGELTGLTLLSSAIAVWLTNVVIYALAYWQTDRGGPMGRAVDWQGRADFSFPRGEEGDGVPPDWQPTFPDYLYLAFNTATAFSPTDALPLTIRAKMMMMSESIISLVIVIAVAARAINILGS